MGTEPVGLMKMCSRNEIWSKPYGYLFVSINGSVSYLSLIFNYNCRQQGSVSLICDSKGVTHSLGPKKLRGGKSNNMNGLENYFADIQAKVDGIVLSENDMDKFIHTVIYLT